MSNAATGRPVYGDRFDTGNQESALLARGFTYGTAPGALNIGWNGRHTAVTLPDGTPVSSGEGGGVRIGGQGAYQRQFNHHMFLPVTVDPTDADPNAIDMPVAVSADMQMPPPAPDPAPENGPVVVDAGFNDAPPPAPELAPDFLPIGEPAQAPIGAPDNIGV